MNAVDGIEVRHQQGCPALDGGRCKCRPKYRAAVYDARTKKRVRRTFDSRADAKRWRQDAQVDLRRGVLASPVGPTVAEAGAAWLSGAKRGVIRNRSGRRYKPSTLREYEQALRDHIVPRLGTRRLSALRSGDVQQVVDELLELDLSASTVRNALLPLRVICRRSITRNELAVNPTKGLELPAPSKGRDRVASPEEAARLIAALPEADQAIWATAFYAGPRFGEEQALRRCDIDADRHLLRIEHTWDRVEGMVEPKSDAGVRAIPIARVLRPYLEPLAGPEEALVFGRSADVPFSPSAVVDRAHRIWNDEGLDPINPHECRHTFASLMIAAGVNVKALQVFMGHSSIIITLDRYGHLMPGSEDEAAELLDAYLAAKSLGTVLGQSKPASSPLEQA